MARPLERLRLRGVRWPTLVYILTIALAAWATILDESQRINFAPSLVHGVDLANYWGAWDGGLYHGSRLIYGTGVYLYSPAFAELLAPLTVLPFPMFRILWLLATLTTFAWLIRPARGPDRMLLIPIAVIVSIVGGIEWLYCLVLVFGLRHPALWALPILTKVTPGVGLVWFVARREWRKLAIAIGATAIVVGVSFALAPALWFDWIDLLHRNMTVPHYEGVIGLLPIRIALAAVVVWWGARRGRPEALVAAMVLAAPDINWTVAALVLALPRMLEQRMTARSPA
jgi:hypothetical protein